MFERYSFTSNSEEIQKIVDVDPTPGYRPVYNAAPTKLLPIITDSDQGGFSFFYWGLPPEMTNNRPVSKKLVNINLGEAESKTSFRNTLVNTRCLLPMDGFYSWKKISRRGRIPYRYIKEDKTVFFAAGLWEEFDLKDGESVYTFKVIVNDTGKMNCGGAEDIEVLPIQIGADHISNWLSQQSSIDNLLDILTQSPVTNFTSYPVSSKVNNIDNDSADLIIPTKPMDQYGNYSLFD